MGDQKRGFNLKNNKETRRRVFGGEMLIYSEEGRNHQNRNVR